MIRKAATVAIVAIGTIGFFGDANHAYASQEVFGKMEGKFRGKGLVRATSKGKKESIRCRMNNTPASGGKRLEIGGSCAVSGFVFSLKGFIEQTGGRNYRASMFRSLANIKQEAFGGRRNGSRINFSFNAQDRLSKKPITASIRLNVKSASAYSVQISRSDPDTGKVFSVGTLEFAKR